MSCKEVTLAEYIDMIHENKLSGESGDRLTVAVLREAGHVEALHGMSMSHGLHKTEAITQSDNEKLWRRMRNRAMKLAHMQGGHNKFLESIIMWLDVRAPRYWWQQADTYRLSTKQSESTMHTVLKYELTQEDFYEVIPANWLELLNHMRVNGDLDTVKRLLPESFMQRRVWCVSYKTLQNIYLQRKDHKLREWRVFLSAVLRKIEHPEYIKIDA